MTDVTSILFLPAVITLILNGCNTIDTIVSAPMVQVQPADLSNTNNSGVVNGDFSQGFTGWINQSEGPGLSSGVQEIIDVDGRPDVLHLDSRSGGNYYLFHTQTIATGGVLNSTLSWDWNLAQIEGSYGLAAVWLEFNDNTGEVIGRYFVRRHTGSFSAYECSRIIDEICNISHPDAAIDCEQLIGTSFGWETKTLQFNQEFFNNLGCNPLDPATVSSIKIWIQSYNNAGSGVDAYFDNFVVTDSRLVITMDIKPRTCPNLIKPKAKAKAKAKLAVAILGTVDFDVSRIDVSTVLLEGVAPIKSKIKDVSSPAQNGVQCGCPDRGPDGFNDLELKFIKRYILDAIRPFARGDVEVLTITGALLDGTPFEASDCIVIREKKGNYNQLDVDLKGEIVLSE